MKNLKLFCIVAVVMAIVPCLVHAGTLSGPFVTSTPISFTATDWAPSTESLTFPKFNSALGTLDAVTLDLTGSVQTTATVYNLSASVDSSPAASMGTAGVTSGFTVSDGTMNLSPNYGVTATSTFGPLAPGVGLSSFQVLPLSQTGPDNSYTTSDAGVLADFTGNGIDTIQLSATTASTKDYHATLLSGSGLETLAGTAAALTGSVTYSYTPVVTPEPSTFALLAVGVLGLMGYGWRKRTA